MSEGVAVLERVDIRFGELPVLTGVDLSLRAGEVIGIAGANGSGKSTLLRVLSTLLPPAAGSGRVFGARLGTQEVLAIRRRITLIGHLPALYPEFTLEENLKFASRLAGVDGGRVDRLLEVVGLAGARDRRVDQSSQGMQRRVELARAMLTDPDLLLLDEAHAGLDQAAADLIAAVVNRVRSRGGSAVLVSHEMDRMLPLADTTYRIEDGRLQAAELV